MATATNKVTYNFNEGTAVNYAVNYKVGAVLFIHSGVITGITHEADGNSGFNAIFNADTDNIEVLDFHELDGLSAVNGASWHFSIRFDSTTGTNSVFENPGIFNATFDGTTFVFNLELTDGTASVNFEPGTAAIIDISIIYNTGVLEIFSSLTGILVSEDTDSTFSGSIETDGGTNPLHIGESGVTNSARFRMTELKIYDGILTFEEQVLLTNNRNGFLLETSLSHSFLVGDLIVANIDEVTPSYAVVTEVKSGDGGLLEFRIQTISGTFLHSLQFNKVGHIFDINEDDHLLIDKNGLQFYDNINVPADVGVSSNKIIRVIKEGVFNNIVEAAGNYTLKDVDSTVFVTNEVTITLPSSPLVAKEYLIMHAAGTGERITIDGNGKNINGESEILLLSKYDSVQIIYTGSEYIVK